MNPLHHLTRGAWSSSAQAKSAICRLPIRGGIRMETHDHEKLTVGQIVLAGGEDDEHLACGLCGESLPLGICFGCGTPLNERNQTASRKGLVTGCHNCKIWNGKLVELPLPLEQYRDRFQTRMRGIQRNIRDEFKLRRAHAAAVPVAPPGRPVRRRSRRTLILASAMVVAIVVGALISVQVSRTRSAAASSTHR
jgi:hypothetical protein